MTGIVQLAGARSINCLAMISVCPIAETLAGNTIRITVVSKTAAVAIRRSVLFSTLAFAGGIRAVPGQVARVTLTRCERNEKSNDDCGRYSPTRDHCLSEATVTHVDRHQLRSKVYLAACRTSACTDCS